MKDTKTEGNSTPARKIVKNVEGYLLGNWITIDFSVSIGISFSFLLRLATGMGLNNLAPIYSKLCWCIGLVPPILETNDETVLYPVLNCYLAACMLQLYLPIRAMSQPSFMAGKPNTYVRN